MKPKERNSTKTEENENCELQIFPEQTSKDLVTHGITKSNGSESNKISLTPDVTQEVHVEASEATNCSFSKFSVGESF